MKRASVISQNRHEELEGDIDDNPRLPTLEDRAESTLIIMVKNENHTPIFNSELKPRALKFHKNQLSKHGIGYI